MRQLILLVLLLSSSQVLAQKTIALPSAVPVPIDSASNLVEIQKIIAGDSLSGEQLTAKARTWVAKTHTSANDAVQQEDQKAGVLVVKRQFDVEYVEAQPLFGIKTKKTMEVFHTLIIESKPGRSRITLNSFETKHPDFRNDAGKLIQPARLTWVPANGTDAVELLNMQKTLEAMPMASAGWAKRNAPVYLYSKRNLDRAIYEQAVALVMSFTKFMSTKQKDW